MAAGRDGSNPDPELDPLLGVVLEDRYEIRRPLARGAMGKVYAGFDRRLESEVAIKLLSLTSGAAPSRELEQRFEAEAKILARLRDPRILRPLSWGRTREGQLFLVTELLEGQALDVVLREGGALGPERTLRIMIDVCRALTEAHAAGVIHRDLKPANLFLQRPRGGEETTRVLDFGIAKVEQGVLGQGSSGAGTLPGSMIGTVAYMSPEQVTGRGVGPQADLYGLGVVAYECLTGGLPFSGDAHAVLHAHVTERPPPFRDRAPQLAPNAELEALVQGMLEKDPAARPESASQVIREAERILAGLAGPAKPAPSRPRKEWILTVAAAVAVVWMSLELLRSPPKTTTDPVAARVPPAPVAPPPVPAPTAEVAPRVEPPPSPEPLPAPPAKVVPKPIEAPPKPRSARLEVSSRVGLAETGDNDRALGGIQRSIIGCAREAPLPLEVAIVLLEGGRRSVKALGPDGRAAGEVEACIQATVNPVALELSGKMGMLKLRLSR